MATFVLIPGAGGAAWYWHRVAPLRRVARERLGLDVDEVPGGHLVALSRPRELAALLLRDVRKPKHPAQVAVKRHAR